MDTGSLRRAGFLCGIGLTVAVLSAILGAIIGIAAAWYRRFDTLLMRVMDALVAFPAILLAIGISAALGPHLSSVIIALTSAYIPRCARIVRASALVLRETDYVDAARLAGASRSAHHHPAHPPELPRTASGDVTFVFAYAILAEATLSFLGIGTPPPTQAGEASSAQGRDYSVDAWWIMLFRASRSPYRPWRSISSATV
ncbi:ABC transporter permease [Brucella abortus]|nr:ABC transporter permease [Brucella abortus]